MDRPHKRLVAWQASIDLVETIYTLTSGFPESEKLGLVSQMRRAGVSVASNLAEGAARAGLREQAQFFIMSKSSLSELDTQLEISARLSLGNNELRDKVLDQLNHVSALIQGLINQKKRLLDHSAT
ncbi:MAG: four helix bundle protein [Elusimicrobia bacterium]|nr:four helix bundle protein [Elusimicrobiota bacterium]